MLINQHTAGRPEAVRVETLTGRYGIDPEHSSVRFSVRHAVLSRMRGTFTDVGGLLLLAGTWSDRSLMYVDVRTESLCTGAAWRDARIKGPSLFDSVTFPLLSLRSVRIAPAADGCLQLDGRLLLKDLELPLRVVMALNGIERDARGARRLRLLGNAALRRSDWGLGWNTPWWTAGALFGDRVDLAFELSAVRSDD
ncbi:YceI family protein [Streptomyces sp. NPDC013178]|uniref:YceI family protein n=1 Tax=Streptomyces sp. NPDC013178 TaxID=3155118 RepID=UPI0033C67C36